MSVTREPSPTNSMANAHFRAKQKLLGKAEAEGDCVGAIWLHERPYRLGAMLQYQDKLTDEQYWQTLRELWMDSENIWQDRSQWIRLLRSRRPGKANLMTPEELAKLESLPDKVTIWRGCTRRNKHGVSWTLSENVANFFAHRFRHHEAVVLKRIVRKHDIVAYFGDRKEQEVLVVSKGDPG